MSGVGPVAIGAGIAARIAPGGGEAVLWIHGYTLDSSIWDELWGYLPGWRHIGIDLPGHGASHPPAVGEDLGGLARRIGDLALQHNVRHVVGLSFGGMVALQVAIERPNAFASLILGSPALGGGPQDRHAQACNLELMRLFRGHGLGPWLAERWLRSPPDIFAGASRHPPLFEQLRAVVHRHGWLELRDPSSMQRLTQHRQTAAGLRRINAATLVIIGEHDMAAFKRCADIIQRSIPGCARIYIPSAGHLGLLEAASAVHPLIAAHWRAHGAFAGIGLPPDGADVNGVRRASAR
jgi:pimeloyl-ACP methyl ester carboxylesterase